MSSSHPTPPDDGDKPGEKSGEKSGEKLNATPFARVLSAYMWRQQPPWSAAKTAKVLGIHRSRVVNWIYQGKTPELDTMIAVLAQLNIPIRILLDAYAEAGLPVPPLDVEGATSGAAATGPSKQLSPEEAKRREWEIMVDHTRRVMTEAGMPLAVVNAMLAELEQRRADQPSHAQRRVAEEMRESPEQPEQPEQRPGADPAPRRKGAPSL